jgi:TatA/E family protein of Tat protein translocase
MFGIGPLELMVVLVLALIVFGPEKLPELMRSAGHAIREFQRYSAELTSTFQETTAEFTSAMDVSDVTNDLTSAVQDAVDSVTVNGTSTHEDVPSYASVESTVEITQVSPTSVPSEYETAAAMLEPVQPWAAPIAQPEPIVEPELAVEPAPMVDAAPVAEAESEPAPVAEAPKPRRTRKKPAPASTEGVPLESVVESV